MFITSHDFSVPVKPPKHTTHEAYRKAMLPQVDQAILRACREGNLTSPSGQKEVHCTRSELDNTTAAKLLACFSNQTGLSNLGVADLIGKWNEYRLMNCGIECTIGEFTEHLWCEEERRLLSLMADPASLMADPIERLQHLRATLYVAGFLYKLTP